MRMLSRLTGLHIAITGARRVRDDCIMEFAVFERCGSPSPHAASSSASVGGGGRGSSPLPLEASRLSAEKFKSKSTSGKEESSIIDETILHETLGKLRSRMCDMAPDALAADAVFLENNFLARRRENMMNGSN